MVRGRSGVDRERRRHSLGMALHYHGRQKPASATSRAGQHDYGLSWGAFTAGPRASASTLMPKSAARRRRYWGCGTARPRSHLYTAPTEAPICTAISSCDQPRSSRNWRIVFAMLPPWCVADSGSTAYSSRVAVRVMSGCIRVVIIPLAPWPGPPRAATGAGWGRLGGCRSVRGRARLLEVWTAAGGIAWWAYPHRPQRVQTQTWAWNGQVQRWPSRWHRTALHHASPGRCRLCLTVPPGSAGGIRTGARPG